METERAFEKLKQKINQFGQKQHCNELTNLLVNKLAYRISGATYSAYNTRIIWSLVEQLRVKVLNVVLFNKITRFMDSTVGRGPSSFPKVAKGVIKEELLTKEMSVADTVTERLEKGVRGQKTPELVLAIPKSRGVLLRRIRNEESKWVMKMIKRRYRRRTDRIPVCTSSGGGSGGGHNRENTDINIHDALTDSISSVNLQIHLHTSLNGDDFQVTPTECDIQSWDSMLSTSYEYPSEDYTSLINCNSSSSIIRNMPFEENPVEYIFSTWETINEMKY